MQKKVATMILDVMTFHYEQSRVENINKTKRNFDFSWRHLIKYGTKRMFLRTKVHAAKPTNT
jgi:hypothetical protein